MLRVEHSCCGWGGWSALAVGRPSGKLVGYSWCGGVIWGGRCANGRVIATFSVQRVK
ncbi:hypothetical protein BDN67DRAFT_970885 [Paxillus ammoniavirescens]|nr:hypothetical protein BDN67DRAFT_970885 [Paxillus ammoniavirescens]